MTRLLLAGLVGASVALVGRWAYRAWWVEGSPPWADPLRRVSWAGVRT